MSGDGTEAPDEVDSDDDLDTAIAKITAQGGTVVQLPTSSSAVRLGKRKPSDRDDPTTTTNNNNNNDVDDTTTNHGDTTTTTQEQQHNAESSDQDDAEPQDGKIRFKARKRPKTAATLTTAKTAPPAKPKIKSNIKRVRDAKLLSFNMDDDDAEQ
jgi:hypothetical protein